MNKLRYKIDQTIFTKKVFSFIFIVRFTTLNLFFENLFAKVSNVHERLQISCAWTNTLHLHQSENFHRTYRSRSQLQAQQMQSVLNHRLRDKFAKDRYLEEAK